MKRGAAGLFLLLCSALLLAALCQLLAGAVPIRLNELAAWIGGQGFADPLHRQVWLELRLPRLALAIAVGGALSVSGLACQAVLRNPLAEPYVLGIASGAALGAVGGSLMFDSPFYLYPLALGGSLVALACTLSLGAARRAPTSLLLAGVVVSFFFSALLLLLLTLCRPEALASIYLWLTGNLGRAERGQLLPLALLVLPPLLLLWARARRLDPLSLDEESAQQAGFDPQSERRWQLFLAAWLAAAAVSFAGLVGFVGLIAPHLARRFFGCNHRRLVPACFLSGALLVVAADAASRWLLPSRELPVGVITALAGAPFFLFLLRRGGTEGSDA